jgi:oxygen-dependent protoporphyrinogen oxidase
MDDPTTTLKEGHDRTPGSGAPAHTVAVVGAGLSGLAVAWRLGETGAAVTVLERDQRLGGVIRSERHEGFLCEAGPNSILLKSATAEAFLNEIGLADEIVEANPISDKRYLVKDGRLVAMPMSVVGGIKTPLYTLGGKLRLLAEPFVKPAPADLDESVASFVSRRLGRQFLDYGIAALVSGIYAGDPQRLSIRHAFPKVWNLEATYGSLIRGAVGIARDRKKRGEQRYKSRMIAFADGVETLTRRLAETARADIRTGAQLEGIAGDGGGWRVRWRDSAGVTERRFDRLVVSVPEFAYRALPWEPALAARVAALPELYYPPVTTLVLGYRREQVRHPLDGFGVLIPLVEGRRVLGAIFSTTIFPDRAPDGHVSLMIFMGGATMPDSALADQTRAVELATGELGDLLGLDGPPVFSRAAHWPRAIPQYNVGHGELLADINRLEQDHPGLYFCANYIGGPGVSDVLDSASRVAGRAAASLTPVATVA